MEAAVDRLILSDEQWDRVAPHLPGKVGDPGGPAADNRMFVEGVLWLARVGAPWRDLPAEFGKWNSVFQRFRRWAVKGVFERLFKILSQIHLEQSRKAFDPNPDAEVAAIPSCVGAGFKAQSFVLLCHQRHWQRWA
jgi:transposase